MSVEEALRQALEPDEAPILIVLAGSNGAGKTAFFETFLRETGIAFVNADRMARALAKPSETVDPYEAAALADAVRRDLLAKRRTFCMETVLSDATGDKLRFLREARAGGYRVILLWIRLASVELSIARVKQRVEAGGHDVPDEKLQGRFPRTQRNALEALRIADLALVIDNSSVDWPFRLAEVWQRGVRVS